MRGWRVRSEPAAPSAQAHAPTLIFWAAASRIFLPIGDSAANSFARDRMAVTFSRTDSPMASFEMGSITFMADSPRIHAPPKVAYDVTMSRSSSLSF